MRGESPAIIKPMSRIKDYLKGIAEITTGEQKSFYEWLLDKGELFTKEDFLDQESRELSKEVGAELKMCYRNSHEVQGLTGVEYYEGFYFFGDIGLAMQHGFNIKEGKVIDVTTVLLDCDLPIEWYGVKVDLDDSIEFYGDGIKNEFKKHINS